MALILVVDDDQTFRELLAAAVTELGHVVLTAENGAAGLEAARKSSPHVIVSDIIMPDMDGVEMNTHLQMDPLTKGLPILMLTGNLGKHLEVGALPASTLSFEYIIGKTAPIAQITGVIREILERYYQL